VVESAEAFNESSIQLKANNESLTGSKLLVPDGSVADIAVVAARESSGVSLYLVDLRDNGVTRDTLETVDPTRNSATLGFSGSTAQRLGQPGNGWQELDNIQTRAAVLFSFEQLGGAQRALDMAVEYSNPTVITRPGRSIVIHQNCRWRQRQPGFLPPRPISCARATTFRCMVVWALPGSLTVICTTDGRIIWRYNLAAWPTGKTN